MKKQEKSILFFDTVFSQLIHYLKDVWIAPNIPEEKLALAKQRFAFLKSDEEPVVFFESPGFIFKSKGKRGILVTTNGIHWKIGEGVPQKVYFKDLNTLNIELKGWTKDIHFRNKNLRDITLSFNIKNEYSKVHFETPNGLKFITEILNEAFILYLKQAIKISNE